MPVEIIITVIAMSLGKHLSCIMEESDKDTFTKDDVMFFYTSAISALCKEFSAME